MLHTRKLETKLPLSGQGALIACSGLTLLELMIVVALMAILASLAIPSYESSKKRSRIRTDATALATALQSARSEALQRNMAVSICASSDGATCDITSGDWSEGWITFSDLDGDAVVDGGDGDTLLSISESAYDGNTIAEVSTRDNLTFNGLGEAVVTGPVTFRVCGPEKVQSFARGE